MHTIVLNQFIIKIYPFENGINIDKSEIDNIFDELNSAIYPKDLSESLVKINGVCKIKIYDKNNKLLSFTEISDVEEPE
jgi:hypothetical protein